MIFRLSAGLKLCHKKRGFRRSLVPAVAGPWHIGLPTLLVIIINWVEWLRKSRNSACEVSNFKGPENSIFRTWILFKPINGWEFKLVVEILDFDVLCGDLCPPVWSWKIHFQLIYQSQMVDIVLLVLSRAAGYGKNTSRHRQMIR